MIVFLPLSLNGWSFDYYLSNKVIYDLLPKLKQLRVLSLSHYKNISELPDSVGALKHLRHLDLSGSNIKRLPSVVCKLYNLQSLLLSDCKFLTELPEEIAMLVNLRHLDISGTQLQEIPAQIARLENLQTLSGFVVSRQQNGLKLHDLKELIIFDIILVKTIGPEFYGCCSPSFQPFPSLETEFRRNGTSWVV
ncbi:hypothetical protein S245_035483 [Arachis hypogaea]